MGGAYLNNVELELRMEMEREIKAGGRKWTRQDEKVLDEAMVAWRQGVGDVASIVQAAGFGITKLAIKQGAKKALKETIEEATDADYIQWRNSLEIELKPLLIKESHGTTKSLFHRPPQPTGQGQFGPIFGQFRGKPIQAEQALRLHKTGEATAALYQKDIGYIDLIWGVEHSSQIQGYGLAKVVQKHPEVLGHLQELLDVLPIKSQSNNRVIFESSQYRVIVSMNYQGSPKKWLFTAFERLKK